MPSYKDSPKPLRKSDPNPLFTEGDDGYIVKAMSPIEQQRHADGSLHSMTRPSSVHAPGIDESLYLGDDKMDKSVEAQATRDDIDADEVLKAYMAKGDVADKDKEDAEKAVDTQSTVDAKGTTINTSFLKQSPKPHGQHAKPAAQRPHTSIPSPFVAGSGSPAQKK